MEWLGTVSLACKTVSNSMVDTVQATHGRLLLIGHGRGDVGCGIMNEVEFMESVRWKRRP